MTAQCPCTIKWSAACGGCICYTRFALDPQRAVDNADWKCAAVALRRRRQAGANYSGIGPLVSGERDSALSAAPAVPGRAGLRLRVAAPTADPPPTAAAAGEDSEDGGSGERA